MNTPILQQLDLFSNEPDTVTIELSNGQQTIISDMDADLAQLKWWGIVSKRPSKASYYVIRVSYSNGQQTTHRLHREIMSRIMGRKLERHEQVDHINGDTLDNRRENLRFASASQNALNKSVRSDNTSGYKGVSYWTTGGKWKATTCVDGKTHHIGFFNTAEEAYAAYCKKAKELHGEFYNPG